ncbi:MAG TPA: hypothetical protein VIL65_14925 [Beijerinckiaceae bacterium]|jgi:hypothetical protein
MSTSAVPVPDPFSRAATGNPLARGLRLAALVVGTFAAYAGVTAWLSPEVTSTLTGYFLIRQDAPVLALLAGGLWAAASLPARRVPLNLSSPIGLKVVLAIAALIVLVGTPVATLNEPLVLDEVMALFDARIFREGRLLAPVPPEWRPYLPALQPHIFGLKVPDNAGWASSYLPVNAGLQALLGGIDWPGLPGLLLLGTALIALWAIARRIWPARPDAALVAVVLLASSSQVLLTAMTPFAMTAHLAFNLVWLWLVLRGTPWSHAGALTLGFLACGLHQVVFHPLFAAPFVLGFWLDGRRRLAALYAIVYAAFGLFWVLYSTYPPALGEVAAASAADGPGQFLRRMERLMDPAQIFSEFMIANLARFAAWQNPLTLVLVLAATAGGFANWPPIVRRALWGFLLTLSAMALLLPYQGHGWGYRYVHGCLGGLALVAAQGWVKATEWGGVSAERLRVGLVVSVAATLAILLPVHVWQARSYAQPYAAAVRAMADGQADVVVVEDQAIWYGHALVRNEPFLRQGPKVMALRFLDEADIARLCARYAVRVFDQQTATSFGLLLASGAADSGPRLPRERLRDLGCQDWNVRGKG